MKKLLLALAILFLATAAALWIYGRPAYHHFKETRFVGRAKTFLAKADLPSASLSARMALQANPRNVDACQIMSELAERSRSPALLDWRRRIAELSPTLENKLMVASAALAVQDPPYSLASQMLNELAGPGSEAPTYHVVAAELALKLHDLSAADAEFQRAQRLEPSNTLHQLNLSVLRLQSTNPAIALEARTTLERLRTNTNLSTIALRWLVADAVRNRDWITGERCGLELVKDPRATLDDRLAYLTILDQDKKPQTDAFLVALQKEAATNAAKIYRVATWMASHAREQAGLDWLNSFPAQLQKEQPVPLAFVDCYVAKKAWADLETFLSGAKWAELDFLRLAYLSRAAAEQNQNLAADVRWRSAIREAEDRLGALATLLGLANRWGRDQAKDELLWHIARRFPRERWATSELTRRYQDQGNTIGLNKLSAVLANFDKSDFGAQNNLAATSLLLRLNLAQAHELARNVYLQHADQPVVASTYAFSLYLQGHTNEALATFEKLAPGELDQPAVALYYGLVLSANGKTNQACKYLGLARLKSQAFLPEERALMAQAAETAPASVH